MPRRPALSAIAVVRVAVAILLGIHGAYRMFSGGVAPFGNYLGSRGLPFGLLIAWGVTLFEMGGGVLLALRRSVIPVGFGFLVILVAGIALVHAPEGWFVVGGGRNGVEFSVLLIVCLAAILLAERQRGGVGHRR